MLKDIGSEVDIVVVIASFVDILPNNQRLTSLNSESIRDGGLLAPGLAICLLESVLGDHFA